ncbi:MAG: Ni/Fe hydrogenase subunit alpha [Fidelibacterota bacterium]|nr:MAG: Ni/Fe hydrogenase subunit alpha [Candidatus Neomarinimicrobiota bacterium]
MKVDLNIDLHHLTRVEGHGNIHVQVKDGKIKQARWDVVETPRYFEVMLKGKHYTSAGILTARICGICSIGHCLASLRATEQAFGINITNKAAQLRLLAKHGETLQSHILHLFFLAAPDFLKVPSAIPLLDSHPDIVAAGLRLKALGNRICEVVGGRATHPVSLLVGGVARMPEGLDDLQYDLESAQDDLAAAAELFGTFDIPEFQRETEFVSLKGEEEYPWIGGRLVSSDGVDKAEHEYTVMTNEEVVENNTSKWCKLSRESFAVGALARFNNNHHLLHPQALEVATGLGLKPVCHNPFMNNVAQLVECVHVVHDAMRLVDALQGSDSEPTLVPVTPKAGEGISAVEVPRGILYHHYRYDEKGYITKANCVIPTTQNNANIHHTLRDLVAANAREGMTSEQLELLCSMLVRAYDPCVSCSVH